MEAKISNDWNKGYIGSWYQKGICESISRFGGQIVNGVLVEADSW